MNGNPRIEGAEERWRTYRSDLTAYVMETAGPEEKVLVIGAGACDDLELMELLQDNRQVFLLDCNPEALQVSEKKAENHRNLHIVCKDAAGLTEQQLNAFRKACEAGTDQLTEWQETYEAEFQAQRRLLYAIRNMLETCGCQRFDRIICMGFHSQIYMPLILILHEGHYSLSVHRQVQQMVERFNRKFAEEFIDVITRYGQTVYLGYEYASFLQADAELREEAIERLTEQGSVGLHQMRLSRVEGAYQLEQEIGNAYKKQELQIADCVYMLWPFSEEKSYLMVIFKILCYNERK